MQRVRIALAQLAPTLGALEDNLDRHRAVLAEAKVGGANLIVFPELGLTGYLLQDLAAEVAMRLDDPRLASLIADTRGVSTVFSFVEESADHRLFIAAVLVEDGAIRHVHRKLFLPTYGLFDERRFFAAGDLLRAVPSELGVGIGLAVCEDFWHLAVPQLARARRRADPHQRVVARPRPGVDERSGARDRDVVADDDAHLCAAHDVVRRVLQPGGRRRVHLVLGWLEVIGPTGEALLSAPFYDEGLFTVDVSLGDVRRERIALPLLRDERPELHVRELQRIVDERAGLGTPI